MYQNIPQELKLYNNWILWRYETINDKQTKVPYGLTGKKVSTTNPAQWHSFDAVADYKTKMNGSSGFDGIGFVFSPYDPFCGIDLDHTDNQKFFETQVKIYNNFNSYSEVTPSGNGLHIIVYGNVPQGRKRDKIEVYSTGRFFTFTGQVYNNAPIAHRQGLLDILWAEMGPETPVPNQVQDRPETDDDRTVLKWACDAANGEKFMALFQGNWQGHYPSQSEADFALIDMLAFYTQNIEQIKRLWAMSPLSTRNKQTTINRVPYLDHMINRAFDRQLPYIDLSKITVGGVGVQEGVTTGKNATPSLIQAASTSASSQQGNAADVREASTKSSAAEANLIAQKLNVKLAEIASGEPSWPEGLLGEIAQFIYRAAPRPCYEIALSGAIGLMAGICGRSYNVSGFGLNQYILTLAATGTGKEAVQTGISKLMLKVKEQLPAAGTFVGPGEIRSDAGLLKWFSKNPSFLSIAGEFGLRLKQMSQSHNSYEIGIKRMLLDLYGKSREGSVANPMAYSDKEKNTDVIISPSLTILGESTPETFYENIDEQVIIDGLLPRFLIIEYKGECPVIVKGHHAIQPSKQLIDSLCTLASISLSSSQNNKVNKVEIDAEAEIIFDELEKTARQIINNSREVMRQLWSRAHGKAIKLAALLAVGINPYNPVITKKEADFALKLVNKDIKNLCKRYDTGDIGEESKPTFASDDNQLVEIAKIIKKYIKKEEIPKYGMTDKMLIDGVYNFSSVMQRTAQLTCFKKDKMGSTYAFKRAFQTLIDAGDIQELNLIQAEKEYGKRAKCFIIRNYERFM